MPVQTLGARLLKELTPQLRKVGAKSADQAAAKALAPDLLALDHQALAAAKNRDVVKLIARLDAPLREASPRALADKYKNMAKSPARFLSGQPGVMAHDQRQLVAKLGADTAVTGDAHMRNVGTVLMADGSIKRRFDDFDEATIAPAAADFNRMATHIVLEARELGYSHHKTAKLVAKYAKGYYDTMAKLAKAPGEALHIKAPAVVKQQMRHAERRDLTRWLAERAPLKGGRRMLPRNAWHLEVPAQTASNVTRAIEGYRASLPKGAAKQLEGYKVTDVASVLSGTGSAGEARFEVLLERGKQDEPILLQLKQQDLPSIDKFRTPPVAFKSQAERNVALSNLMDDGLDPLRGVARVPGVGGDMLVERLAPGRMGTDVAKVGGAHKLGDLVRFDGAQAAKAHARGAQIGLAGAPQILPTLGSRDQFIQGLVDYAHQYADQVTADHAKFVQALKLDPLLSGAAK